MLQHVHTQLMRNWKGFFKLLELNRKISSRYVLTKSLSSLPLGHMYETSQLSLAAAFKLAQSNNSHDIFITPKLQPLLKHNQRYWRFWTEWWLFSFYSIFHWFPSKTLHFQLSDSNTVVPGGFDLDTTMFTQRNFACGLFFFQLFSACFCRKLFISSVCVCVSLHGCVCLPV